MRRIVTLAAVIAFVGVGSAAAQSKALVDTISAVDKGWAEAYVSCNVKAWDALLGDDMTFIHNNGSIDDKAKQMASVKACPLETLNSQVQKVRVYGDDTAVVLGAMQGKVKAGDFRFDLLYTRVYVKQHGAWKLVSHQSTDAPKKKAS